MARTPSLLRCLVLCSLLASAGCASWHYRKENRNTSTSTTDGGPLWSPLQWLSDASANDWNFRNPRW